MIHTGNPDDPEGEIFQLQVQNDKRGRDLDKVSSSMSHGYRKISDSLFELNEPHPSDETNLDIFFFHGLQLEHALDAHLSTWKSGDEIWPRCWLAKEYPQARIISVSYDACLEISGTHEHIDLSKVAETLMSEIAGVHKDWSNIHPVILVGHSFGGLLIKHVCLHASRKERYLAGGGGDMIKFLDNIRGICFYDTPHLELEMDWQPFLRNTHAPVLSLANGLIAESVRLHEPFCQLWREKKFQWIINGLGGTSSAGQHIPIVPESSSKFGDYITVASDHYSICRPTDKSCEEYKHLIKLIEAVFLELQEEGQLLKDAKRIIGVESFLSNVVKQELQYHAFLGISGIAGSGKTTMAKLVFEKLFANFQYTCFVEGSKLIPGRIEELKEQIWGMMSCDGKPVPVASGTHGEEWYELTGRKLLLVFDDITEEKHVDLLERIADDNGLSRSRFILTSHDSRLLRRLKDVHICPVPVLAYEDAKQLFLNCAFLKQEEPPDLKEVVEEVVRACDGFPATLEILGILLRRKQMEVCDMPRALRYCEQVTCLKEGVWDKLMRSYEELGEEEKNMFLDVATFFEYCSFTPEEAEFAWNTLYRIVHLRVQTLVDRSLIQLVNDGYGRRFHMHEHLRRMGERIARESGRICDRPPPPRAHRFSDGGFYPFNCKTVSEGVLLKKVVADRMEIVPGNAQAQESSSGDRCRVCLMNEVFKQLESIRFLELQVKVSESCNSCSKSGVVSLPPSLVMLKLSGHTGKLGFRENEYRKLVVFEVSNEDVPEASCKFSKLEQDISGYSGGVVQAPEDRSVESDVTLKKVQKENSPAQEQMPYTPLKVMAVPQQETAQGQASVGLKARKVLLTQTDVGEEGHDDAMQTTKRKRERRI